MQAHQFAVGEIVLCAARRHPQFTWRAPYTIIARIDTEAAEPQYRIVSVHRHEIRIAGEHELCRTPQPIPAFQQSPEQFLDALSCLQPANLNLNPAMGPPLFRASKFGGWGEHLAPYKSES